MKSLSRFFVVLLPVFLIGCKTIDQTEGQGDGSLATLKTTMVASGFVERASDASLILLGEKHDNEEHHQIQKIILESLLTDKDGVVFEMLKRDQQPVIDQYIAGSLKYGDLEAALKWEESGWPDWAFYGPLIKAAKTANARILYGSYPKSELRSKMKPPQKEIRALSDTLMNELDEEIRISHCDMLPTEMIRPMSNIQIAKDDLLASQLLKARGNGKAFLIAGNGHVRKDRAVPYYLAQKASNNDILVLGLIEETDQSSQQDPFTQYDIVWVTGSAPEKDYCAGLRKRFKKN